MHRDQLMTHFKGFHSNTVNVFFCLYGYDKIDFLFKNYEHSH